MIDITMDIILDKPEQMLFALLRSALNSTKPVSEILFTDISPALWQACYKLACTQGVMALAASDVYKRQGLGMGRNTDPAGLFATPEGFEVKLGDGGREL